MLRYLLDTNIVIYVIKQRPMSALQRFNQHAGHMAISSITLAELLHGAEKSNAPERSLNAVEDFCSRLEKAGQTIGINNLHIAAHARSEGLRLVSNNLREFDRVPALLVDNWVMDA